MIGRAFRLGLVSIACAMLAACASTVAPRPELVAAGVAAPLVQGRATLVMPAAAANQSISAHPTSFTGSATSITFPMGQIVRTVGEKVFAAGFSKGVVTSETAQPDTFGVSVDVSNFTYAYDQASSLGFAITPKVSLQMTADVRAPDGKALLHKTYSKTDVTPGKYAISGKPAEKINEGLHMALGQMFRDLLDDIAAAAK
ncbi:MAG: hypothetical protein ACXU8S_06705 [Phenylobacterium sp.]